MAALLHDIGKYSFAFQKRLEGSPVHVDHSTAGAQELIQRFGGNPADRTKAFILAYCIAGHHGGLPDYGSPIDVESNATLRARLKRRVEDYSFFSQEFDPADLTLPERIPIKPIHGEIGFSLSMFIRMIYSALVDADFLETETFVNGGKKPRGNFPTITTLCQQFNHYLTRYDNPQNPVDRQRTAILQQCLAKSNSKPGLFSLTVPTGGGKTLASMAFALNHAVANNQKRIIYVIPFTSIIEQNAAVFKASLGDENVLEHHSNFDWNTKTSVDDNPDNWTNDTETKLKLASENWDIPVIVTTNVQFFESLFANRSSRCRKLHHIANSVVIFDEAQMLPREYLKPCMLAIYDLVKNYGVTAVFCTATQPNLEQFLPEGAKLEELAPSPQALFDFFKRVQIRNLGKINDEDLIGRLSQHAQVLCIVNTRKHAKGLFESLPEEGRFHLSTLMCPAHRRKVIGEIRERLKNGQPCRVISTQIMEAGIDVDFPVGFRATAGMDSIIQAAGRVNREGKRAVGELFVFEPDTPFISKTPKFIQQGADIAQGILRDYEDPVSVQAIQVYFSRLYSYHDPQAFDSSRIVDCFQWAVDGDPAFSFATAAKNFTLIESNTQTVLVRFDPRMEKLLRDSSLDPVTRSRKLQAYSVNIYENEYQALQSRGLLDTVGNYVVLNDDQYYDPETGLEIPIGTGEAIFIDC